MDTQLGGNAAMQRLPDATPVEQQTRELYGKCDQVEALAKQFEQFVDKVTGAPEAPTTPDKPGGPMMGAGLVGVLQGINNRLEGAIARIAASADSITRLI